MVVVMMRVTTLRATAPKHPGLLAYYAGRAEDRDRFARRAACAFTTNPATPRSTVTHIATTSTINCAVPYR